MPELVRAAGWLYAVTLLPALLLLLAPLLGARARTVIAVLFLLVAAGFAADVVLVDHSQVQYLEVPNVFPRGPEGKMYVWTVAREAAPAWHWHLWVVGLFGAAGLWLLLRRKRIPGAPSPAIAGTVVFLFYLIARVGFEKGAMPAEVIWAVGCTPLLVVLLPFVGWYAGSRGSGFLGLVGTLLGMAYMQRLPLAAFGLFATLREFGTHLDVHVVTDISLPMIGERSFQDPVAAWLWTTLLPQATVWVLVTLVAGIVLGILPWSIGRRFSDRGEFDVGPALAGR